MGFYQPAQIVIDAANHGVEMREVDINYSDWDNQMEKGNGKYHPIRLGFRQVKGLAENDIKQLIAGRRGGYRSIHDLREAGITDAVLEKLADADALRSIGYDRRKALWEATTKDHQLKALFNDKDSKNREEENISLPEMTMSEHVVHDYASLSLSLKAHPVSFIREQLMQLRCLSASSLKNGKDGDHVKVAGLILVRQRPGTASGICFITLEDETGVMNLVVWRDLFDQYRREIIQSRLLMVEGKLQIEGEVIHVIVKRCFDISRLLQKLIPFSKEFPSLDTLMRSDEKTSPGPDTRDKTQGKLFQGDIFHEGRNFR